MLTKDKLTLSMYPVFEGVVDKTILQGQMIDLREGVSCFLGDEESEFDVIPPELDNKVAGEFEIQYVAGGTTETCTVTIEKITSPIIYGLDPVSIYVNDTFDLLEGVSAKDGYGRDIDVTVDDVTFDEVKRYEVNYTATDEFGNSTTSVRVIEVKEDTITIHGAEDKNIMQGDEIDLMEGVYATRESGRPVSEISVAPPEIDTAVPGETIVRYTCGDAWVEITVKVNKIDDPVIYGVADLTAEVDQEVHPLEDVSAIDGKDNPIEVSCIYDGTKVVDVITFDTVGEYDLEYVATDAFGNTTSQSCKVFITAKSLYNMTKEELIAYAEEIGLHGLTMDMTKQEMIDAILEYLAGRSE